MKYLKLQVEGLNPEHHVTFFYFGKDVNPTKEQVMTVLGNIHTPRSPGMLFGAKDELLGPNNDIPVKVFKETGYVTQYLQKLRESFGDTLSAILGVNLWDFNYREYRPHVTHVEGVKDIRADEFFCVTGILTNDDVLVDAFH